MNTARSRITAASLDWLGLRRVSVPQLLLALALSIAAWAVASVVQLPIWMGGFLALSPWTVLFTREIVWTYKHAHWLAMFYALAVSQSVHFTEHVAQMIQLHVLGLAGDDARGVIGVLDVEWVHFIFNTWVIVATVALLDRFRSNRWLWIAAVFAGWHEVEHIYLLSVYLSTGLESTSGLLAAGGAIGGGLPIFRADLHFLYNLAETIPLMPAFFSQLVDESLRTTRQPLARLRVRSN